ncbi:hypothetical protein ACFCYN_10945 [Gottfriedia sp. NPDC056225]|uniref:hypothetical protein n=1 Tax=Gottfriedia sp. NPDC056225 TaxID=3345751 RepID=UPI0035D64F8B
MKKVLVVMLSFVLLFCSLGTITSKAEVIASQNEEVVITPEEAELTSEAQLKELKSQPILVKDNRGIKSKAVIKVAQLMRAVGDEVIDMARAFNIIDSKVAKTMKSHSGKIAQFLDKH